MQKHTRTEKVDINFEKDRRNFDPIVDQTCEYRKQPCLAERKIARIETLNVQSIDLTPAFNTICTYI